MAAATLRPQMTAATEHGQAVLRLDDSKRKPSDSGSTDIRDYMQNKRSRHGPAEEDGKMEIGGILVDDGYSDEIEYLTCGEEETDDARSQIVCSLDECGKRAEMRVICQNKYCLEWGWKYFCRTHLRAWECNSCGDDGWSESASAQDPPEEGEDQDLPDEDEEDEDNSSAQSLTVTSLASSSADGGVAQSLSVPQQVRNSENDGVAQSLSVAQQARRGNGVEMDMDMENQERAMLEAESKEEEMLEAEGTEGALSISRVGRNFLNNSELFEAESDRIEEEMDKFGMEEMLELERAERAVPEEETDNAGAVRDLVRNFLTDRELLEAESLHMIDPSGYTSAEADVREAIFRERLVRKQQQRNTSRSRALRQLAELDEREIEIESMGAEMLAAGEWDAELDADDIMMIQTNYMNRAAGYSSAATSRDDSRPKIPITDLTSLIHDPSDQHRPQPHNRVLNDMKSLHSARQLARPREAGSAFCSPCDGSGNIMR